MRILLKNSKNGKFWFLFNPIHILSDRDLNIAQNDHHNIAYRSCFHHFSFIHQNNADMPKNFVLGLKIPKNGKINVWGFQDQKIK